MPAYRSEMAYTEVHVTHAPSSVILTQGPVSVYVPLDVLRAVVAGMLQAVEDEHDAELGAREANLVNLARTAAGF